MKSKILKQFKALSAPQWMIEQLEAADYSNILNYTAQTRAYAARLAKLRAECVPAPRPLRLQAKRPQARTNSPLR